MRDETRASSKETPVLVITKKVRIGSRQGLHARPAALFVQVANRFKSDVTLRKGRHKTDGKSIMGILTLAAGRGNHVEMTVSGPDAREALHALEQVISHGEPPAVVHVVKGHSAHGAAR